MLINYSNYDREGKRTVESSFSISMHFTKYLNFYVNTYPVPLSMTQAGCRPVILADSPFYETNSLTTFSSYQVAQFYR